MLHKLHYGALITFVLQLMYIHSFTDIKDKIH